jgi:hypothetical protein
MEETNKILHLTTDNKFIQHAYDMFECVFPGQNHVIMLRNSADCHLFEDIDNIEYIKSFDLINPLFIRKFNGYDFVILHSLILPWINLVNKSPSDTKFAWIGWGYDYYDLIAESKDDLLLPDTRTLTHNMKNDDSIKKQIASLIKWPAKKLLFDNNKVQAISKIKSFSPVLYEDYLLLQNNIDIKKLPQYIPWNYGNIDAKFKKCGEIYVEGNAILVGNSAAVTNNHLEVFDLLKNLGVYDREIIVPLSYGNPEYRDSILEIGSSMFGNRFEPLLEFMPMDEYIRTTKKCGFVIMNHIRQQAVGNIINMLYMGAKVFLNEKSPVYEFFNREGAVIYTTQELEHDKTLLNSHLSKEDVQTNISVIKKHFSEQAAHEKTKKLVEYMQSL